LLITAKSLKLQIRAKNVNSQKAVLFLKNSQNKLFFVTCHVREREGTIVYTLFRKIWLSTLRLYTLFTLQVTRFSRIKTSVYTLKATLRQYIRKSVHITPKKTVFRILQLFYNYFLHFNIVKGVFFNTADLEKTHDKKVVASPSLCIAALLVCPLGEFCFP